MWKVTADKFNGSVWEMNPAPPPADSESEGDEGDGDGDGGGGGNSGQWWMHCEYYTEWDLDGFLVSYDVSCYTYWVPEYAT